MPRTRGKFGPVSLTREEWDALLDGEPHDVDLTTIRFPGGLAGFRTAVYREAERRYGYARTKRIDGLTMRIQGFDCRPELRAQIESQGGRPNAYPRTPVPPAPQEPAATTDDDLTKEERDAVLGPCTCGQDPMCLPTCARF